MSRKQTIRRRGNIFDATVPEEPQTEVARVKRTYHLPTEVVVTLDEIQTERFKATGIKPDLSDLVAEAIRELRNTNSKEYVNI